MRRLGAQSAVGDRCDTIVVLAANAIYTASVNVAYRLGPTAHRLPNAPRLALPSFGRASWGAFFAFGPSRV